MQPRRNRPAYNTGLEILANHPDGLSLDELTALMEMSRANVMAYLKIWREDKRIRVRAWRHPVRCGKFVPLYGIATRYSSDAPKPDAMTANQRAAKYREKMRVVIRAKKCALNDPFKFIVSQLGMLR